MDPQNLHNMCTILQFLKSLCITLHPLQDHYMVPHPPLPLPLPLRLHLPLPLHTSLSLTLGQQKSGL